jgi:hypothetical protein
VSVRVVIVIGVLLVALFVISIVLGACGNNNTGSADLSNTTNTVQNAAGGLIAKPLTIEDVRETTPCVLNASGCVIGPNQTRSLIVVKSDDSIRRVRRATFAQLKTGSSAGSAVTVRFTPVGEDASTGEVRSNAQLTPVPASTPSPEVGRVQVNISQNGGQLTITCFPPTGTCLVKLIGN